MPNRDLPPAQGLYDPRFEHDSCGVGFVVDMQGRKSRTLIDQALSALCNLNHRGAAGAEPDTGDGAGILVQMPDRVLPRGRALRAAARGRVRHRDRLPPEPTTPTPRPRASTRCSPTRASPSSAGATCRSPPTCPAPARARCCPRSGRCSRPRPAISGDDLERHVYAARKRIEHETGAYFPSLSRARRRLQGHAHARTGRALLRRPPRRAVRVGALPGPLALQHQHVPVVAARAPVPDARAQRRDQHRAGQRELDAGA